MMNLANDEFDPVSAFGMAFSGLDHGDFLSKPELALPESGVFGNPGVDAGDFEHQTTEFTCAVVSQQMILKQFGIDVSEARLVYDATSHGWLSDSGTAPEDAGRLLEYYGVHTHTHVGGEVEHLIAELAHGHKVIVAVDSGEMWGDDWFIEDLFVPCGADHALVITGIDVSDPSHPRVFVNDPGDPNGSGKAYPLDQFLDAWSDSGRYFVATDDAPPELAQHAIFGPGFDPPSGLYLDKEFWMELAVRAAEAAAAVAVSVLLDHVLNADTVGDISMRTVEHLTDGQRDQLFCRI